MIDIHAHILPAIDDGSKDMEMTLEMLKKAKEDGVNNIIATPHYCADYGEETYETVKNMVEQLNEKLIKENIEIKVHYGQEVYYNARLLEELKEGVIGTINNGRYLLIEFDMRELREEIFETLYELRLQGIIPIVAHPERYVYIKKKPEIINKFIDEGCLFQLNSGSIRGHHGKDTKKCSKKLLKYGIYSFIGSDAHNIKNRKTGLSKGIKEAIKIDKEIKEIFRENGEKVILNKKIEFKGRKMKKKRGIFSFLKG